MPKMRSRKPCSMTCVVNRVALTITCHNKLAYRAIGLVLIVKSMKITSITTTENKVMNEKEATEILLTVDGKGKNAKKEALEFLLREATKRAVCVALDEALNSGDGTYKP